MKTRLKIIFSALTILLISTVCLGDDTVTAAASQAWPVAVKVFLLVLPVLVIFIGAFFYLRHLQRNYHQGCIDSFKFELLAKSPLGLPEGSIAAILRLIVGVLLIYIVMMALIMINIGGLPSLASLGISGDSPDSVRNLVSGLCAITFLVLVIIGAVYYMQRLQTRFFDGCIKTGQIEKFFQAPAGLPDGTIRAVLALIIVSVSLFFIVFQFFTYSGDTAAEIPPGLMTLLTAVVAFYFANRAGTQGAAESVAIQTQSIRDQRDTAVKEQQKTEANTTLGKVYKALAVTQAASAFLPPEVKKKYDALAEKLQAGLSAAEGLINRDNPAAATELVSGALSEFGRTNPAFQAVANALPVFNNVLGASIPALGLITAVVGVGVRISSAYYERWKMRILQAPIDAATLQIQPIDGLMAERLFIADPVLKQAFATELNSGESATLAKIANDFMTLDTQSIWANDTYRYDKGKERFESQAVFEQTVQIFRRLMSDPELKPYVEPGWLGPMNNYDHLMSAVDQLHENDEARARLDELILVIDGLKREGQPVLQIMEKIEEELKKNGTAIK